MSYISNAAIGLNLSYDVSNWIGVGLALLYSIVTWKKGVSLRESKAPIEAVPVYN
jgi:hypothetical protein